MRFVSPETTRYHLANGVDWIDVKKELTVGEDKRYRMRGLKSMSGLGAKGSEAPERHNGEEREVKVDIDWEVLPIARVEAWVADWSEKRPFTRSAVEALATEDFEEIDALVLKHIALMDEEKKARAGSGTTTSPSS
ncbi:MAG TPA: hypothetical protein VFN64_11530 [Burkholderiaceae bacterium]|nr:hypothetical protein [Burkholderiaceae bacterium]